MRGKLRVLRSELTDLGVGVARLTTQLISFGSTTESNKCVWLSQIKPDVPAKCVQLVPLLESERSYKSAVLFARVQKRLCKMA